MKLTLLSSGIFKNIKIFYIQFWIITLDIIFNKKQSNICIKIINYYDIMLTIRYLLTGNQIMQNFFLNIENIYVLDVLT